MLGKLKYLFKNFYNLERFKLKNVYNNDILFMRKYSYSFICF